MSEDTWASKLRRAWIHLQPPDHDGVSAFPVANAADGRQILVGTDRNAHRHLLIPTLPGDTPRTRETDGEITVRRRTLTFDQTTEVVDVACIRPESFDDFDELCGILLPALVESERPAAHLVDAMGKWRQLLRERARQGLSAEERLGLFGELAVLERLTERGLQDIECWEGPFSGLQDIVLPGGWVEVKTKVRRPTVRIHGLDQTTPPTDGGRALLAVVELGESETVGMKTSELIETLEQVFDRAAFAERLAAYGWQATEEPDLRYSVERITYIDAADLPALVVTGDAERITGVSYDLDVNGLPATGEHELDRLISPVP